MAYVQVEIVDPSPDQINALVNLYYTGQMVQTEQACRGLLQAYPQSLVVINLLGASLQGQGKLQEAVESFDKVIELKPDYAAAYSNRGAVLKELGQLEKAVENYNQAIQLQPDLAETYSNRGIALQELEQLVEAVESFNKAIQLKPDYTEAYSNRGATLQKLGQLDQAVENYDKAIQIQPDYAEAYYNRGNVLKELGQLEEAAENYDRAIQLKPDYAEAYSNRGLVLQDLGQLAEAVESYDKAIQLKPDYAETYSNRAVALQRLGQFSEAKESCDKAIQLKPDYAEAYSNLGSVLKELGQLTAALEHYDRAIQLKPDYADAYYNRGIVFQSLGQLAEALENYALAIQFKPDYIVARWNLSLLQLNNGYLSDGFKNYEVRWSLDEYFSRRPKFSIPRWTGETLTGKSILIWAEQGIGDEIQFATLIPEFEKLECHVGIECAPKLVAILQWSFPWAAVREAGGINCEGSEVYSQFDYQIPMGSLAPQFRKTLDDFRNFQKPFIPRLRGGEQKVRDKLKLKEGQLLIGLSWRSSKQSFHDLRVEDLAPLKSLKDVVFLAVQYDDCLSELDQVRSLGLPIHYYTNVDQKDDISSTCALLGACDLIISPATAVFQLAGSLGVPTIAFDAFKCYFDKIPWYPTVRELELNPAKPSLLINEIISEMPEIIDWANAVTTSGRCIDSYSGGLDS